MSRMRFDVCRVLYLIALALGAMVGLGLVPEWALLIALLLAVIGSVIEGRRNARPEV